MFLATNSLKNMKLGLDGIWGEVTDYGKQEQEKSFRQSIANEVQSNYLNEISLFHSIPVMDAQVKLFLNQIPKNGVVLDIGGCWGWHWRNINKDRPDITIVIIDLIRENLLHAKKILKDENCIQQFTDDNAIPYFVNKPTCTKYFVNAHIIKNWTEENFIKELERSKTNYIVYSSNINWFKSRNNAPNADKFIVDNYFLYKNLMPWKIYKKR